MNDKKSCENCVSCRNMLCYAVIENTAALPTPPLCRHWLRDPSKWLSILPTESGWYWLKLEGGKAIVKWIDKLNIGHIAGGNEWQGPITPKEG